MSAAAQLGNDDDRERGAVKWFNSAKGFGFITRSTGEDVFVHFTEIQMAGYRTLDEGVEVEYDLRNGDRGLMAQNVIIVGAEPSGA